jgi:Glycoside hydrolase family 44
VASDPARDGTAVDAEFSADWVRDLVSRYGGAAAGGVGLYELGNEPALWSDTHRDMHPQDTTYDELWQKSRDYAAAVKGVDPAAKVLGFSEWGWPNYFCSGADHVENGCSASSPDRAAHDGVPLVDWLLRRWRAYEQRTGTRLVDYIDVHYYRQGGDTTDVTRSLWDPTYTDPSWIADKIRLIPRMKQWVAHDYPGTKLALSEYNLSVPGDAVTNGLIQADVLGIFAREGMDLATRWGMPYDGDRIDDAFRLYRDYDGAGGKFGDLWIRSVSADQSRLAVYGARRTADGDYTLMVINKSDQALTSRLDLTGIPATSAAQAYSWTGGAIRRLADRAAPAGGFTATFPARSATLYVIAA